MWKDKTRATLNRYLSPDASDLCMRYFELVKSIDELAAGRQQIPDVVAATADFIGDYHGSAFYAKHYDTLYPMAKLGYRSWAEALEYSKGAKTNAEQIIMAMARRTFHEFAIACAQVDGRNAVALRGELISSEIL